jgi:hypothetical protein
LNKKKEAGMEWIIHLDTDELLHPAGAAEYSLRRLLADTPSDVDLVVFPNYVSVLSFSFKSLLSTLPRDQPHLSSISAVIFTNSHD